MRLTRRGVRDITRKRSSARAATPGGRGQRFVPNGDRGFRADPATDAIIIPDDRRHTNAARVPEDALLDRAYFGHAGGLAALHESGHVVGADLMAAFRAEQRPLDSVRRGRCRQSSQALRDGTVVWRLALGAVGVGMHFRAPGHGSQFVRFTLSSTASVLVQRRTLKYAALEPARSWEAPVVSRSGVIWSS
jgi:hypothetical protein